jgi:hypothetical protein
MPGGFFGYPNLACPAKPADCANSTIIIASSTNCLDSWDIRKSEIKRVFLAPFDGTATSPIADTDMEDLVTWDGLIDNVSTTAPFIRELYCVGDMPLPEANTFEYKGQSIIQTKTYTVNFDLIDVNDTNYSLSRDFDNNKQVWLAYETDGGSLYGWMHMKIDSNVELTRGNDSLETIKFIATTVQNCKPPRYDSPFAS